MLNKRINTASTAGKDKQRLVMEYAPPRDFEEEILFQMVPTCEKLTDLIDLKPRVALLGIGGAFKNDQNSAPLITIFISDGP